MTISKISTPSNSEDQASALFELGIENLRNGNVELALSNLRDAVELDPNGATFYYLGRIYEHPGIGQLLDAFDCYSNALVYGHSAQDDIRRLQSRLKPTAELALIQKNNLTELPHFDCYVNPFQLFQISDDEEVTSKRIQRAKTAVLHELELNDGKIEWLQNSEINRSLVLLLEDQLTHPETCIFHRMIAQNPALLQFLAFGDCSIFLEIKNQKVIATSGEVHRNPSFRLFISKPFAEKLNQLGALAFDCKCDAVIAAIFTGRRWLDPKFHSTSVQFIKAKFDDLLDDICDMDINEVVAPLIIDRINNFGSSNIQALSGEFLPGRANLALVLNNVAIDLTNDYALHTDSLQLLELSRQVAPERHPLCNKIDANIESVNFSLQSITVEKALEKTRKDKAISTRSGDSDTAKTFLYFFLVLIIVGALKGCSETWFKSAPESVAVPTFHEQLQEKLSLRIDQLNVDLEKDQTWLRTTKNVLADPAYNSQNIRNDQIQTYNSLVDVYNQRLQKFRQNISEVNALVEEYNKGLSKGK